MSVFYLPKDLVRLIISVQSCIITSCFHIFVQLMCTTLQIHWKTLYSYSPPGCATQQYIEWDSYSPPGCSTRQYIESDSYIVRLVIPLNSTLRGTRIVRLVVPLNSTLLCASQFKYSNITPLKIKILKCY